MGEDQGLGCARTPLLPYLGNVLKLQNIVQDFADKIAEIGHLNQLKYLSPGSLSCGDWAPEPAEEPHLAD